MHLPGLVALFAGDVDEHVGRLAELLQRHLADAEAVDPLTQLVEVDRLGGADLDDDAAAEVDDEVEAEYQGRNDRRHFENRRHGKDKIAQADEDEAGLEGTLADQRIGSVLSGPRLRPERATPVKPQYARYSF